MNPSKRNVTTDTLEKIARNDHNALRLFAPWQQRHLELQRQMDLMIGPLRDHVRQAASRASMAALESLRARSTTLPITTGTRGPAARAL